MPWKQQSKEIWCAHSNIIVCFRTQECYHGKKDIMLTKGANHQEEITKENQNV